jgi:hypothetical protein
LHKGGTQPSSTASGIARLFEPSECQNENRRNYYIPKRNVHGGTGGVLCLFRKGEFLVARHEIDDGFYGRVQAFGNQQNQKINRQPHEFHVPTEKKKANWPNDHSTDKFHSEWPLVAHESHAAD